MSTLKKLGIPWAVGLVISLVWYDHAYAYVDPSTGSFMLQSILAGALGALFALKLFWKDVRAMCARLFATDSDDQASERS